MRRLTLDRRQLRRVHLLVTTRPLAYWAVMLAVAVGLAALVQGSLSAAASARASWGTTTEVLVATRDLRPGDALDAAAVEPRRLPIALVADGVLTRLPAGAVVAAPIAAGEPVHGLRVGRGGASPVAALLPPGTRGVAMPRPEGLPLAPGDRVDVVASLTGTIVGERAVVVAVAERAVVVAIPLEALGAVAAAVADGGALLALA